MRTAPLFRSLVAVALAAASVLTSSPPLLAQEGSGGAAAAVHIPFERYTLPNGLTVILSEDHTTPTVAVDVWYHVGSKNEKPGRTGFAHLFEHIMFTGSGHVPYGMHDRYTEGVGGGNNGSTTNDRTNYFETVPSNYLEDALWLESDRMGWLLDALDTAKLNAQRDIVKNERRQSYENRPYGRAGEIISGAVYPPDHPYHWPVIGSMADLSAASAEDVKGFFRLYYAPNNATVAIVGDFDRAQAKTWVRKYFGEIPRGEAITRPRAPVVLLAEEKRLLYEDRVQVPRLYLVWPTVGVTSDDQYALDVLGAVLSGSRTARLTKGLVYDRQSAADVRAWQDENELVGEFQVVLTPRPGHSLTTLELTTDSILDRLRREGPTERELQKVKAGLELGAISRLQSNLAKADILDAGSVFHGDPAHFRTDLASTQAVSTADVQRVANQYLTAGRVVLSIVPMGKPEMAARPDESTHVSRNPTSPTSGREELP